MGLLTWIRNYLRPGMIPYGGTLSVPFDDDLHPIAIANELHGGMHGYRSLDELSRIPVQRLQKPMSAIVLEHVQGDGTVFPRTTFIFDPTDDDLTDLRDYDRISDVPGFDLSVYWKAENTADVTAELETQFAPEVDYGAVSGPGAPAFREPTITAANYQLGYKSDADHTVIWSDDYDTTLHKYQRQRVGSTGKWGIPVRILGETYSLGDYIDNRFKWVAKTTVPSTPKSIVNGLPNNEPAGWSGTPDVPGGGDYYVYANTHDLFRISASKDAYQNLKSEWSTPILISTDKLLVRYGYKPSSTLFINVDGSDTADWRGYYTPNLDTHMAIRISTLSPWRIENIDKEEGEYVDYIFKAFPVSYEPNEDDRPSIANPFSVDISDYPNNGFKDYPFEVADNEVLYYSVGRKFNNGDLKPSGWSIPTPANGQDIIQVVIVPTTSTTFKYDANHTVSPSTVVLRADFFKGKDLIGLPYVVKWYKGVYSAPNEIIKDSIVGVSQYHVISGTKNETLTIQPNGVDNTQLYTARIVFDNEDYYDTQTVLDVSDSLGYLAVIESDDGFVYKNQTGTKNFVAKLYNNGVQVSNGACTFQWFRGVTDITPVTNKHTVAILGSDFIAKEVLKVNITTNLLTFSRTETLVDIDDAEATIWQYTTEVPTPGIGTVWTTTPTGAVWARISTDGGTTYALPFKVRGESAPYNGGFYRNVYKISIAQPTATGLTSDLFPNPSTGWTDVPVARTAPEIAAGNHIWQTTAFFTKIQFNLDGSINTGIALNTDNWAIAPAWGDVFRITGVDGNVTGPPGAAGEKGWSPVLAAISRGPDVVHQVIAWTGGTGTAPSTGNYIADIGFTSDINAAKNVRGQQGASGVFNSEDFWDGDALYLNENIDTSIYIRIKFRKNKAGIVYYHGSIYNNGRPSQYIPSSTLPLKFRQKEYNGGSYEGVPLNSYHQYSSTDNDSLHLAKIDYGFQLKVYIRTNARVSVSGSYIAHDAVGW